jgi:prepilin-type N-terminal cleavage/methylation domain-containing protein
MSRPSTFYIGMKSRLSIKSAFTLFEVLIVVAIISILVPIATQWVNTSLSDSQTARWEGNVKTLNDACTRVRLASTSANPGLIPGDKHATFNYYLNNGYVQKSIPLDGIDFISDPNLGVIWAVVPGSPP